MIEKKQILKQSGALFFGYLIAALINFFIPIVVVRVLDQSDFGVYKQLFLISGTFATIFSFGIAQSLYYFMPGAGDKKKDLVSRTYLMLIMVSLLTFISVMIFGMGAGSNSNLISVRPYLLWLALATALSILTFNGPFEHIMIIEKKIRTAALFTIISNLLKAAAIVLVIFWTGSILYALVALTFISLTLFVFNTLYLYQRSYFSFPSLVPATFKDQLIYIIPFGLAGAASVLWRTANQYIVSFLYTPAVFAIYSVGCLQIPLVFLVSDSLGYVLLSKVSELKKQEKIDEILTIWLYSHVKLALVFLPIFTFFLLTANDLITILFTERFLDSVPIFKIMLIAILLGFIRTTIILRSFAATDFLLKSLLISLVFNLAIIYPFIKFWGLIGAALSFALSLLLNTGLQLVKVQHLLKVTFMRILPWRELLLITVFCISSSAICSLIIGLFNLQPVISIILAFAVFFTAYSGMVVCSPLLLQEEKAYLKKATLQFLKLKA